jgi:hypothetical protein
MTPRKRAYSIYLLNICRRNWFRKFVIGERNNEPPMIIRVYKNYAEVQKDFGS